MSDDNINTITPNVPQELRGKPCKLILYWSSIETEIGPVKHTVNIVVNDGEFLLVINSYIRNGGLWTNFTDKASYFLPWPPALIRVDYNF